MSDSRDRLAALVASGRDRDLFECVDLVIDCIAGADQSYVTLTLVPTIRTLLENDDPEIEDAMIDALPDFVDALIQTMSESAEPLIVSQILPLVHECFGSESESLVDSYATILTRISMDNFLLNEIPVLKKLCHSDDEDVRYVVVEVLELLSTSELDTNKWAVHLLEIITILTNDSDTTIRAELPIIIGLYARHIKDGKQIAQLAAKFSLFCRDSGTNVRAKAAEAIVTLSQAVDAMTRIVTIVPAAHVLLSDQSEKVRSMVTRNLGPLIASIGSSVDALMVAKYVTAMASVDVNVAYATAYSFPAVALCLGRERFHELESGFEAAANSNEFRIRRTLAFSFCQYAALMERGSVGKLAMSFLRDVSTVAIGIVSNLQLLLELVESPKEFLFCLQRPSKHKEWRMRFAVAQQVQLCQSIFDRVALLDIAKDLIEDPVWKVRRQACSSMAELIRPGDLDYLYKLTTSENRHSRMAACWVLELLPDEMITDKATQYLTTLCSDPVPNVRISLARAAHAHRNVAHMKNVIERLKSDLDIDVRNCFE